MWKPIYQPEPWPQFVKRKDIKGLPLMEQRKKYMQEQLLFENYLSTLNTVNTVSTVAAGAVGGPAPSTGGGGGGGYDIIFKINTNLQAASEYWTTGSDFYQQNNITHTLLNDVSQFWYNGDAPTSPTDIDWGDGNIETGILAYNTYPNGNAAPKNGLAGAFGFLFQTYTHSYDSNGEYTVQIKGDGAYDTKLGFLPVTEVVKYDNTQLTSYQALFLNAQMQPSTNDFVADWDTSNATELVFTFANISNLSDNFSGAVLFYTSSWNPNVSNWNVSNVTTMNRTFMGMQNFNRDLSGWNTSNITSMIGSFWGCSRLVSGGRVDQWDMSSVTTNGLQELFKQSMRDSTVVGSMPHVGNWDLTGITTFSNVFSGSGFSHTAVGESIIGWSSGSVANNINATTPFADTWDGSGFSAPVFNTGSTFGAEVSASYDYLVTTKGWTLTGISFT